MVLKGCSVGQERMGRGGEDVGGLRLDCCRYYATVIHA
jgi:hypothetical protein